jgi:hypothetical protein
MSNRGRALAPLLALGATLLTAPAAAAQPGGHPHGKPFLDVREPARPGTGSPGGGLPRGAAGKALPQLRSRLGTQGVVQYDTLRGGMRAVAKLDGYLTPPSGREPGEIALAYVRSHTELFGLDSDDLDRLDLVREYTSIDGVTHLTWAQTYGGVPAFDNSLRANVTQDGRVINVLGSPLPDLEVRSTRPHLSPRRALRIALRDAGERRAAPRAGRERGPRRRTRFSTGEEAKLVLFSAPPKVRLAWRLRVESSPAEVYDYLVDAASGRVLRRENVVKRASGLVFDAYPGAPVGGDQQPRDFTPWLSAPNRLRGNNAHVWTDIDGDDKVGRREDVPPSDGAGNWTYPRFPFQRGDRCPAAGCSWRADQARSWRRNLRQNATQLFYFVNTFHDHLLAPPIGFTEAAGNFQDRNSTGRGRQGDRILVQASFGADGFEGFPFFDALNNATFEPRPDGKSPRMRMFLFTEPFFDVNGGDDPGTVYHEYTHGLTNRLVTDTDGSGALVGQGAAMDEAWADWYAMDFLAAQGVVTDTDAPAEVNQDNFDAGGRYLLRTQPLDCPVGATGPACPGSRRAGAGGYTYGDYGRVISFPEVHADGEIWGETLWDLRRRLIADHGEAEGTMRARDLVTRAMELGPPFPTFLDTRNSILLADEVRGYGDAAAIWEVFAARGMGYLSSTSLDPDDVSPVQDFSLPPPPGTPTGTLSGTVTNRLTGGALSRTLVYLPGHIFGTEFLGAFSDSQGRYEIPGIPVGTYPVLEVLKAAYERGLRKRVQVNAGMNRIDIRLDRDWASLLGGARVSRFTGEDFSPLGCGPAAAVDQSLEGWISPAPGAFGSGGRKFVTVKLPRAIRISELAVDPAANCEPAGIDDSSSVGPFKISTSRDGRRFKTAASGRFRPEHNHVSNRLRPKSGSRSRVRYVRFTMIRPQANRGRTGPERGESFQHIMGVTELEVYGTPSR